jgi:hypothetical protein
MNNNLINIKKILLSSQPHNKMKGMEILSKEEFDNYSKNFSFVNKDFVRGYVHTDIESKEKTPFYILINPSERIRSNSRTKNNFTFDIINTWPSWSDFPKRNNSIFILNQKKDSLIMIPHNRIYKVYPIKGSKLGVCPNEDLNYYNWPMIKKLSEKFNTNFNTPGELFNWLIVETRLSINYENSINYSNISSIENFFKSNINEILNKQEYSLNIKSFYQYAEKYVKKYGSFVNWLDNELFNPYKNGFKLVDSITKINYLAEVWTSDCCLMELKDLENYSNDEY